MTPTPTWVVAARTDPAGKAAADSADADKAPAKSGKSGIVIADLPPPSNAAVPVETPPPAKGGKAQGSMATPAAAAADTALHLVSDQ